MLSLEQLFTVESLLALVTLTFLEIILGIDNIIFISIVTNKLPKAQQPKARFIGLSLALIFRVMLLMGIAYIIGLTKPLFTIFEHEVSWRDIILALGGLFLIAKSTSELHGKTTGIEHTHKETKSAVFSTIIFQIVLLDIVFSFDSILTAIGLSNQIPIMVAAIVISIIVMMLFSGVISDFVNKHITLQILALSFLILIGFMLMIEAFHYHVPKGYIYFAVAFSLAVEELNLRVRKSISSEYIIST
jgi:predicted tellurium resistance membrane protein TerC